MLFRLKKLKIQLLMAKPKTIILEE